MTLRTRLTLLFLAAVEVTFLSAVAAYWGLQSWHNLSDAQTLIHEQNRRLLPILARLGPDGVAAAPDPGLLAAVDALASDAQTVDEAELAQALRTAVRGDAPAAGALDRLAAYYEEEQERLRARGARLAHLSDALLAAIVALVIASFLAFLAAIRAWFVEPVRALERATEIMSTGDLTHRIAVSGDDELARLAAAINRMAASLAHIQTQLVTSERFALMGELAAYVAHNIRNPLASVRATAQGEAIDLPADDPRRSSFEDIVKAADRLDTWVTDLLRSLSPVALEPRPGSMNELVAHCVELARPQLRAAGIELDLAIAPTPAVRFDMAKLEQVVGAVLANAREASPPGGRIAVRLDRDEGAVALSIADAGNGVPPERRSRLFAPFSTSKPSGTGIGLWLSQKILVAHGGTIAVRDGALGGTVVEIRLPVAEDLIDAHAAGLVS